MSLSKIRLVTVAGQVVTLTSLGVLWSASVAADPLSLKVLQQQISNLRQQVRAIKRGRHPNPQAGHAGSVRSRAGNSSSTAVARTHTTPGVVKQDQSISARRSLSLGGSATLEYQKKQAASNNTTGGSARFGRFVLNVQGQFDRWSFGVEQRFYNFKNGEIFHYGWGARRWGANGRQKIKFGFYQVPFGNLRYGFYGFWGSLAYFAGYTNNQAAGVGYRYQNGPWRVDADFFKNDDAGQTTTYGGNPSAGYNRINGLDVRAAYTLGNGSKNHATVSFSARGGQLAVGGNQVNGQRFSVSAAATGNYGPWGMQAQLVDFQFNVPGGKRYDHRSLPTDSVAIEHYGFPAHLPARGQIAGLNVARRLPALGGKDVHFKLYDDAGYLHSSDGAFDSAGHRIGDTDFNVAGLAIHHGPFYVWIEGLGGRNAGLAGLGPNDGRWHWRANATFGVYFHGKLATKGH